MANEADETVHLEEGDEITVSNRETPMTVSSIEDPPVGEGVVVAENQHGRYRLETHSDGSWSMTVSGQQVGLVEVTRNASEVSQVDSIDVDPY